MLPCYIPMILHLDCSSDGTISCETAGHIRASTGLSSLLLFEKSSPEVHHLLPRTTDGVGVETWLCRAGCRPPVCYVGSRPKGDVSHCCPAPAAPPPRWLPCIYLHLCVLCLCVNGFLYLKSAPVGVCGCRRLGSGVKGEFRDKSPACEAC